jgi:hypothetical protein
MSRYQRDVAGSVMKVLRMSTNASSSHRTLLLGQDPHKYFLTTTPGYLTEGPCNMRQSQKEPVIEIGEAQEALKFNVCGWGWSVMDDMDLGWIHMHTMLINDVA